MRNFEPNSQRGNVLFLILIAVALFAALSYVVTNSTRTTGSDTSKDKARMIASDFVNYGVQMRGAIQRMLITGGCKDTQINFSNAYYGTYYDNPNAPADGHCNVFSPKGGGVTFRTIQMDKTDSRTPEFNGAYNVVNVGTSEPELMLVLHMQSTTGGTNKNTEICRQIFELQKLNVPSNGQDNVAQAGPFKGTYTATGTVGDTAPQLAGQSVGCWSNGPGEWWSAYYVLIER